MQNKVKKKQRLDQILVDLGYTTSLSNAKALIMAGKVIVCDQRVDKPGTRFYPDSEIRLRNVKNFASRGGAKLSQSLPRLSLEETVFQDKKVLDVGSSTGGFTDCVLQLGASEVTCVDVGHNQLHWKLRQDSRVRLFESQDIRTFQPDHTNFDWIISDVSFISLTSLAKDLDRLASRETQMLLLIKPQFEVPKNLVPKGGVITNPDHTQKALERVEKAFTELCWVSHKTVPSALPGRDGNLEYFCHFIHKAR